MQRMRYVSSTNLYYLLRAQTRLFINLPTSLRLGLGPTGTNPAVDPCCFKPANGAMQTPQLLAIVPDAIILSYKGTMYQEAF